jgi:hypothetical protein
MAQIYFTILYLHVIMQTLNTTSLVVQSSEVSFTLSPMRSWDLVDPLESASTLPKFVGFLGVLCPPPPTPTG